MALGSVTSFPKRASAPYLRAARGVAPLPSPVSSGTLSVVDGFPLPSTGRVRGHCDLLTSKPEFLGVITPPITSEFSGSFSLVNRALQHAKDDLFDAFQVTSSVRFQTSDEERFLCRRSLAIFPRSHARI